MTTNKKPNPARITLVTTLFFSLSIILFFIFSTTIKEKTVSDKNVPKKSKATVSKKINASPNSPVIVKKVKNQLSNSSEIAIVTASKLQIVYQGIENPLSIAIPGVPADEIIVDGKDCRIQKVFGGHYYCTPHSKTKHITLFISAPNGKPKSFGFRVKKLPDPVAKLGNIKEELIHAATLRKQKGLTAHLKDFDFDVVCKVRGYELVRIPKNGEVTKVINGRAGFTPEAKELIQAAQSGDYYLMTNVHAQCQGEVAGRKINPLVFNIK